MQRIETETLNALNDEEVAAATAAWEAAWAEATIVVYDLVPIMEGLGIELGETSDEIAANAMALSEEMGGAGNAVAIMTAFMTEFAPSGTAAGIALDNARQRLDEWNISIGNNFVVLLGVSYSV